MLLVVSGACYALGKEVVHGRHGGGSLAIFQQHEFHYRFTQDDGHGPYHVYACPVCRAQRVREGARTYDRIIEPTIGLHGQGPTMEEAVAAALDETVRDLGYPDFAAWARAMHAYLDETLGE